MKEKNIVDRYIEYINNNILQNIDYDKLHESYDADMVYAKDVLNRLHEAMVKVYGGERLDESHSDEGFVVIPGVVCGKGSKNLYIALLELDLSSAGEHWSTVFLCKHGAVSTREHSKDPAVGEVLSEIGAYDYCYTATIPSDIHVDEARLPSELKSVLKDFRGGKEGN